MLRAVPSGVPLMVPPEGAEGSGSGWSGRGLRARRDCPKCLGFGFGWKVEIVRIYYFLTIPRLKCGCGLRPCDGHAKGNKTVPQCVESKPEMIPHHSVFGIESHGG